MRLWHEELIPYLPRQQLLGQHRECCALRGKGWGRKHSTVDYVFTHSPCFLVAYHYCIMEEMRSRNYYPHSVWNNPCWRGSQLGEQEDWVEKQYVEELLSFSKANGKTIYPEHDDDYLRECLDNLKSKGIEIEIKGE